MRELRTTLDYARADLQQLFDRSATLLEHLSKALSVRASDLWPQLERFPTEEFRADKDKWLQKHAQEVIDHFNVAPIEQLAPKIAHWLDRAKLEIPAGDERTLKNAKQRLRASLDGDFYQMSELGRWYARLEQLINWYHSAMEMRRLSEEVQRSREETDRLLNRLQYGTLDEGYVRALQASARRAKFHIVTDEE